MKILERPRYLSGLVRASRLPSLASAAIHPQSETSAETVHPAQVLRDVLRHKEDYPFLLVKRQPARKIVIDFSSPNIAKPFHAGHLRSTILGNFIANMYRRAGHQVHRINYLGDWGTQCGIVLAALDAFGSQEKLRSAPLEHLLELYVKGSELDKSDENFRQRVRSIFAAMESGDKPLFDQWTTIRELSLREYSLLYQRIGVEFDEVSGESLYARSACDVAQRLMERTQDGSEDSAAQFRQRLLKSDGSSLYLSRDLAALLERVHRLNFDEMVYVVENAQHEHFDALFSAARHFPELQQRALRHVKFGRIRGLSTRQGRVVLLTELLDELAASMRQRMQRQSTKVPEEEMDAVAEALALSLVIVNDFQQGRTHDYDNARQQLQRAEGDTGLFLQYCHARLHSLERNAGVTLNEDCRLHALGEAEAVEVLRQLAAAPGCVEKAADQLEPVHVVRYLLGLAHASNRAMKTLRVKEQPREPAEARLLLFHAVRLVLASLLQLLGVRPLNQM